MRSFSGVNLLIALLFALTVGVLLNLQATLRIAERLCEVTLRLLSHALSFG